MSNPKNIPLTDLDKLIIGELCKEIIDPAYVYDPSDESDMQMEREREYDPFEVERFTRENGYE